MMSKEDIEYVQKIDVFKEDFDSSLFPYMTDKQKIKCHHLYYGKLLRYIINLKCNY